MTSTSPTANEGPVTPPTRIFPKTTGLTALIRHRNTLSVLVRRDLAVKYQSSALGYMWSLLEPLGMAAIYWFVFGVLYGKDLGLPSGVSYSLYIVAGIFAWMWTSSALNESTRSLTGQSTVITTMKVPREVFPVAKVIARFAEFVVGFPIVILFAIMFGGTWGLNLLWLPAAILMQAIILTGMSFFLAAVNVLYRDIQRVMTLFMRLMFYSTPLIYPFMRVEDSNMPEWLKTMYQFNPFFGIIELHHATWIPEMRPDWWVLAWSFGFGSFLLFFGRWVFHKLEPTVLKQL